MFHSGGKRPSQVEENVKSAGLPPLSEVTMKGIREVYEEYVRPSVHHYW